MATTTEINIENTCVPFTFDMNYKGDEIQQKVCKILGLDYVKGWSILDTDGNLALVHYNEQADPYELGHLRGVVVDTETETVVANSFGYTPTAVAYSLEEVDGKISLLDQNQHNHVFEVSNVTIKRAFEGVVLRVIWYNNKFYQITHKKIKSESSRWGSPKRFVTMYQEANGPTAEDLFDTTKPYSNTVYEFMVVEKSLLVGTRQVVNKPYLVLLSQTQVDLKRPEDQVGKGKDLTTSSEISFVVNESFVHQPLKLTLQEANSFLKYGYYNPYVHPDIRQYPGESLIMYVENEGKTQALKVNSLSYDWRVSLRGNNPNIVHQFYLLLTGMYEEFSINLFNKYIPFHPYTPQQLKSFFDRSSPFVKIPIGEINPQNYFSRDARIQLLWVNYWFSLPVTSQESALNIWKDFVTDRNNVATWLQNFEATFPNLDALEIPLRAKQIIIASRKLAKETVQKGQNVGLNGSFIGPVQVVKNTIKNLVNKERGKSLYDLVRAMKKEQKVE